MTAHPATLLDVTGETAPAVPPARTSEKTRARLSDLRPHPGNPRKITPARLEQLQRTLAAEPDLLDARPLIALPDGTVVAGNQRLAAAAALGWESIPVVYADLSPEVATRWMLLDNRGFGEDDRDAVAALLGELEAAGDDLALTGYDPADLDAMLRELHRPAADPDAPPPVPAVAKSVLGEVYELGPHRVMCGDSTDAEHVSELLASQEPLVMLTDPPYGVELEMEWRDRAGLNGLAAAEASYLRQPRPFSTTSGSISGDTKIDWSDAFELVPSLMVAYVWHAGRFTVEVASGLRRIGFENLDQIIWDKDFAPVTRTHYWYGHEPCWYAHKPKAPWLRRNKGREAPSTIWRAPSPKAIMSGSKEARVDHPTQKPIALYTRPIENHLRRDEVFYEPFGGSGSALIAAEATGTRCFAMEIDPAYCDVIRQRYADYVGDQSFAP